MLFEFLYVTLAVLVMFPDVPLLTCTRIVIVALPPGASDKVFQTSDVPAMMLGANDVDAGLTPAGRVSFSVIIASACPLFTIVML